MIRHSARSLLRQPALLLGLILSVALGVGSNAAVFAFVTGLVGTRTPLLADGVPLVTVRAQVGTSQGLLTGDEFISLRGRTALFESVVGARETISTIRSDTRSLTAAVARLTSGGGKLFQLGVSEGAALSAAARRTLGRVERVTIDGVEHVTDATTPEWLEGLYAGQPVGAWILVEPAALVQDGPAVRTLSVFGRLRPGISIEAAQRELDEGDGARFVLARYTGLTPAASAGLRRLRILLTAAAASVFLIACINVAVLLLSRAARRSQEISIRIALGATRRTLALGLLVDSILVVIPGVAAGALVGMWTARLIPALLFAQDAEQLTFAPDLTSAGLAVLACAVVVIACGMIPLIENRHDRPAEVLRRPLVQRESILSRLQGVLVVLQMAGCCALVVAAALLADSFQSTLRTHAGRVIGERVLAVVEADAGFGRADLRMRYFSDIEQAAGQVEGVFSTAWIERPAGSAPSWQQVAIDPPGSTTREVTGELLPFTRATMDELVLPPIAGRMFGGGDTAGGCPVVVLNEAAASAWFDGNAVGHWLRSRAGDRFEIVGVVSERLPSAAARPIVYYYPDQGEPVAAHVDLVRFEAPAGTFTSAVLNVNAISDGYFRVMGGTMIQPPDDSPGSDTPCRTAILNQEAADLYFGGDATGGAVIDGSGQRTTVVGVVEEHAARAMQRDTPPALFLPMDQSSSPRMTLILAAREAPASLLGAVRQRLDGVDGGRLRSVSTLDAHLARTALAAERIAAVLVGAATLIALMLGIVGLHRAVADDLLRRQQEFATRSALGSPAWRLVPVLLRQGGRWAAAGAVLGLLTAAALGTWLRGLTGFEESYASWVWITGPAVLALGVLFASALPVARAVRVPPLIAMKMPG